MNRSPAAFASAGPEDDDAIRRLLETASFGSNLRVALAGKPRFHPAAHLQTIVARENGELRCMGTCAVRPLYVQGRVRQVGYLGQLRLDARAAGRFDLLRRGYGHFRGLSWPDPPAALFTSIASDNHRARRFLERNLPGMPRYHFLGEWTTLLIPAGREEGSERFQSARPEDLEELAAFLNEKNRSQALAPHWTAEELSRLPGLSPNDFLLRRRGASITACAALWDQRAFKQTLVKDYNGVLAWTRSGINVLARLAHRPGLPLPGSTVDHGFLSHAASTEQSPETLIVLVRAFFPSAKRKKLHFLTVGLPQEDPRLSTLKKTFAAHAYSTRLYEVAWENQSPLLTGLPLQPETALL